MISCPGDERADPRPGRPALGTSHAGSAVRGGYLLHISTPRSPVPPSVRVGSTHLKVPHGGSGEGNISPLQSLFSALGGLIGNGNLAGVATAIAVSGPGAIFRLWIAAGVAMIIVYVETFLAVSQRIRSRDGTYSGGPMYYISSLLRLRRLGAAFALMMGLKTLMATTTIQSNSIALATREVFGIPLFATCLAVALLIWLVTIGGIRSIARTSRRSPPSWCFSMRLSEPPSF